MAESDGNADVDPDVGGDVALGVDAEVDEVDEAVGVGLGDGGVLVGSADTVGEPDGAGLPEVPVPDRHSDCAAARAWMAAAVSDCTAC